MRSCLSFRAAMPEYFAAMARPLDLRKGASVSVVFFDTLANCVLLSERLILGYDYHILGDLLITYLIVYQDLH